LTVSGGVYAAKPRPALIIQDDLFSATESVVVSPDGMFDAALGASSSPLSAPNSTSYGETDCIAPQWF
jgi:mRNA interferase MazF